MHTSLKLILLSSAATLAVAAPASADIIRTATGNATQIQATVDQFRTEIGADNGSGPATTAGRREVNFDGIPDSSADPNLLASGDVSVNRGLRLSTVGSGLRVSADASNPSGTLPGFGGVNPTYPATFAPFSRDRLFAPVDSVITQANIVVPGTQNRGTSSAFGIVLSDVDVNSVSTLSLVDARGVSLGFVSIPAAPGAGRFSFVGVRLLDGRRVTSVRLRTGEVPLSPSAIDTSRGGRDVVAIDDIIYGEPEAISSVQVTPSPAAETDGAAVVNMVRDVTTGEAEVRARSIGGTATPGLDYFEAVNAVARFAPGQRVARLVIPVRPDAVREGDETIELGLSAPGVELRSGNRATVTITEGAPLVTATPGPKTPVPAEPEPEAPGPRPATPPR